ncbi:MAG TPA: hypothetical protein PLR41_04700 [Alphaproteobacteria bacterium]|nr:hypothetical protein [Alphaproteobacteria bacterium]
MPSWIEFRLACRGLLLLARFDADFLRCFGRSASGALRSFWLALPILPIGLLHDWIAAPHPLPSPGLFFAAEVVGYAMGWILFPLLLLGLGRAIERDAEVPGAIAIYNWASLLSVVLYAPATLVLALDRESAIGHALGFLAVAFALVIEGFLLKQSLRLQLWQAATLVALDVVLSIALSDLVRVLGDISATAGAA